MRGLAELGYRQVPIDRLIEMRIHDVTAEWVRGLAAAGYRGIDPEKLVEMRIHDVSAAFIQDAESRGYKGLSVDGLMRLRLRGRRGGNRWLHPRARCVESSKARKAGEAARRGAKPLIRSATL